MNVTNMTKKKKKRTKIKTKTAAKQPRVDKYEQIEFTKQTDDFFISVQHK